MFLKEKVHPKIKIEQSFVHPHVFRNLYDFLSYLEQKDILNLKNQVGNQTSSIIFFDHMALFYYTVVPA